MGIKRFLTVCMLGVLLLTAYISPLRAEPAPCVIAEDPLCALQTLETEAQKIENQSWRDQIYRELAKLLAAEGRSDDAISIIEKIETPDTKALTIRGIGMAAAELGWAQTRYDALFSQLRAEADKITHPPSYAIALTYIAMGQAFAGNNEGAWATAADMENDSLRHKAYGETAEIQAENGDIKAAMKSIGFIESLAYRNKAYATISKIFAEDGRYEDAFQATGPITNSYKKAQAIQSLLNKRRHRMLKQKFKKEE